MTTSIQRGPAIVALAVTAIGLMVLITTMMAPTSPMYSRVGPQAFAYVIGTGLILLGVLLLREAMRGGWSCEATEPDAPAPDWKAIAMVVAGFAAAMALVGNAGFIIAATALFTLATVAFGVRRIWFSALIGFVIAFLAYITFAKLLGLRMGSGIIERLL